jgi:hypothetical protein
MQRRDILINEAKEISDESGLMLKQSLPTGHFRDSADGMELMLMDYVSKK